MGTGQVVLSTLRPLCQLIHRPAAGIGQPQHPGGLVEALPRRVVPGRAQDGHIRVIRHVHDQRVTAGDGQGHKGRLQLRKRQIVCGDMTADVVHRDQRHAQSVGGGLGKADAHQYRADKPRRIGDGHRVDVRLRQPRVGERLVRQGGDGLHVLAGGHLRHHAAVQRVHICLGQYGVGQHLPSVPYYRHRRLVAGGLKRQNVHCAASSV